MVIYYVLNDENKWEINEIYKKNGKLEKNIFNEEHTCIAVINETGKESIIMGNELNIYIQLKVFQNIYQLLIQKN